MTIQESRLTQVITIIIAEICKHDNVCKVSDVDYSKIMKSNKIIVDNKLTLKYDNLLNELKTLIKIAKDVDNYKITDCLTSIRAYLKDPEKTKWIKVLGAYSEIRKDVAKHFITKHEVKSSDIKSDMKILKSTVKKYGKRDGIVLSIDELKTLKKKNPDDYIKYTTAFNDLVNNVRTETQRYILQTHKNTVVITDLNKYLMSKGFEPIFHIAKIDIVKIDINFNLYNKLDSKLACKLPPYRMEVLINNAYDAKKDDQYILKYKPLGGSVMQFCYTEKYKKSKTSSKFEKVDKLMEDLPKMRKKWQHDMMSSNVLKMQLGLATEIVYQTAMRIGTPGNKTNGEPTYGLLTLLVKHVKCNTKQVIFDYIGKAGIHHVHKINDSKIAKKICELIKGKKKSDKVFTITPEHLNDYLRNELNSPVTIHKFRTLQGTEIAYNKLIRDKPCERLKTDAEKEKYLKEVLLEIGKVLGHHTGDKVTGETALKNYIDPEIIKRYYNECNLKMPKKIQQLTEIDNVGDYPEWPGYYEQEPAHKILTYYGIKNV